MTDYSPLELEVRRLIKSAGPMPVWRYMELCLVHPEHGYYVSREPLGREGDFTTAPEVSQMFGELIGLWAASVWKSIGSPPTQAPLNGRNLDAQDVLPLGREELDILDEVEAQLVG